MTDNIPQCTSVPLPSALSGENPPVQFFTDESVRSWGGHGTVTGRVSSAYPSKSNVPKAGASMQELGFSPAQIEALQAAVDRAKGNVAIQGSVGVLRLIP